MPDSSAALLRSLLLHCLGRVQTPCCLGSEKVSMKFTRAELKTIRSTVMETMWELVNQGNDRKSAYESSILCVSEIMKCTPEELKAEWSRDMIERLRERQAEHREILAKPDAPTVTFTDDALEFYEDYSDSKDRHWLRAQLDGMSPGSARSCILSTRDEAKQIRKLVPGAARLLHWPSSKVNPGYYTEITPLKSQFKLRIRRLR